MSKKVLVCVGARPNLMKAASLFRVVDQFPDLDVKLLHTGQHYSAEMDQIFFEQLGIPTPDFHLKVGSASHAVQTAEVMKRFEEVLLAHAFDLIVVIGDINSTVACALVAVKMHIKVVHVEAGLRSGDAKMPEEINRKVVDHISDYLFTTEKSGDENLIKEGIDPKRTFFVGNTMIDTLVAHLDEIKKEDVLNLHALEKEQYCLLTLHRPSNVDGEQELIAKLDAITKNIPPKIKIVFPVHPRTQKMLENVPSAILDRYLMIPPQPYFSFMSLVYHSAFVLTDSGGIQEETTYLKKPCFTLRPNTERPSTIELGSNFLIGNDLEKINPALASFDAQKAQIPPKWDGKAGYRIMEILTSL